MGLATPGPQGGVGTWSLLWPRPSTRAHMHAHTCPVEHSLWGLGLWSGREPFQRRTEACLWRCPLWAGDTHQVLACLAAPRRGAAKKRFLPASSEGLAARGVAAGGAGPH